MSRPGKHGKMEICLLVLMCSVAGPWAALGQGAEAGIDRLSWLGGLEALLEKGKRPPCIGPLGCQADIPEGSPCRAPAKKHPEVVVDGVVPGSAPGTWVVAYRLTCSACYEGGAGYLLLLRVGETGGLRVLDKLALKKSHDTDIPRPLEMTAADFDENGRHEVACHYRYVREKEAKCTGMRDAADYLLLLRPEKARLRVLYHAALGESAEPGRAVVGSYDFDDVDEDGYPDLVTSVTEGRAASRGGAEAVLTIQTVRLYDEAKDAWEEKGYEALIWGDGEGVRCDVPLPGKPYAVVAGMHPGGALDAASAALSAKLRDAGFSGACIYDAKSLDGFSTAGYVTIVSAHSSRQEAEDAKIAVRRAGYTPFSKPLFQ